MTAVDSKSHERAIRINAKLYEARDTARTLLGDKYQAHMARIGADIAECAKARNWHKQSASNRRNDHRRLVPFARCVRVRLALGGVVPYQFHTES